MSFSHHLAIVMLATATFAVAEERRTPRPGPDDPAASAPHPAYRSAFENYRKAPEQAAEPEDSPDTAWREANDTVGMLGGHAGHARGQDGQHDGPGARQAPASMDKKDKTDKPAPQPAAHGHHAMPHDAKGTR